MNLEILYEDAFCLIVNKPHNLLIHNSYYARNIKEDTLLELLLAQLNLPFYPVHRLDRKTSGVLLLAKKKEQVAVFQALFEKNEIQKSYIAIVRGFLTEEQIVNSPVKHPETLIYKPAHTICRRLETITLEIPVHPYPASRYSLIELLPQTGRMHQLRIHMNKISHPIVGDYKYGDRYHNRMYAEEFGYNNLFLHARSLEFKHPITNTNIKVSAPFAKQWTELFKKFSWVISI